MKQNVICWQSLVHHVIPVDGHDGHAQKQVEVVSLVVGPAGFPDPQRVLFVELSLEAQQDPPGTIQNTHGGKHKQVVSDLGAKRSKTHMEGNINKLSLTCEQREAKHTWRET